MRTRQTGEPCVGEYVLKHLIDLGLSRYQSYLSFLGIRFEELGGLDRKEGATSGWQN